MGLPVNMLLSYAGYEQDEIIKLCKVGGVPCGNWTKIVYDYGYSGNQMLGNCFRLENKKQIGPGQDLALKIIFSADESLTPMLDGKVYTHTHSLLVSDAHVYTGHFLCRWHPGDVFVFVRRRFPVVRVSGDPVHF